MTARTGAGGGLTVLLSAVEASADALGASLMEALRKERPEIQFIGCGGPLMNAQGLASIFPVERLAVIGPVAALKALPAALSGANRLARAAAIHNAHAAILIDAWAFSYLAAKKIKKSAPGTKLIKYVAPQVWASRPHRARKLAAIFDGVLTLFEFENAWFEKEGVKTEFTGNPAFQFAAANRGSAAEFRKKYNLNNELLLAVLLGSRCGEINRLKEPFGKTIKLLLPEHPNLVTVIAAAQNVRDETAAAVYDWPGKKIIVPQADRYGAFAASRAALAASGTVTTELAIHGTPMVVAYRIDPLSALYARHVLTTPYLSLLNIAAGRVVIPEFLQQACSPEPMAAALSDLLTASAAREAQISAFPELLKQLGADASLAPASEKAASAILRWINK